MTDTVYRCTDPNVIAAWDHVQTAHREHNQAITDALKRWGFGTTQVYVSESAWGGGGKRLVGVIAEPRKHAPEGWRRERGKDYFVPARSTAAGKKIAKEFDALRLYPNARSTLKSFGMPDSLFVGLRITTYAARVVNGDPRTLWIYWQDADPEDAAGQDAESPTNDTVEDKALHRYFERVKLSEYYAMVEAGHDPFATEPEAEEDS